uniref:FAD dependent oxidoreductase domain-containing protein n=1 Tax=Plectus sambesii TaxID=2011161 RepID=A0A914WRP4_9BILA
MQTKVAVIGAGVSGCSSALALLEQYPNLDVTIFSDRPFEQTTSFGPAGLFRLDKLENRKRALASFKRFTEIHQKIGGSAGVQLVSGHILSDDLQLLKQQEACMADIVFNFGWLKEHELKQFANPSKYAIHFTSFTTEGRTYVPWLVRNLKEKGAKFESRRVTSLEELGREYNLVINCAGLNAGELVSDDQVVPIRGVLIEVDASWHKHFLYRDLVTISIPSTTSLFIGTVKEVGRSDLVITQEDREDIWNRVLNLMPTLKNAKVLSEWIGLRPHREQIRLDLETRQTADGKAFTVINNYGHGANGFTLSWGCALDVVELAGSQLKIASRL